MNAKRNSVVTIFSALATVDAIVRRLALVEPNTQEAYRLAVEARKELRKADKEFQRISRKPASACAFQGCMEKGEYIHRAGYGSVEVVRLCGLHSGTSSFEFVSRDNEVR